jgi:hypothetical protein
MKQWIYATLVMLASGHALADHGQPHPGAPATAESTDGASATETAQEIEPLRFRLLRDVYIDAGRRYSFELVFAGLGEDWLQFERTTPARDIVIPAGTVLQVRSISDRHWAHGQYRFRTAALELCDGSDVGATLLFDDSIFRRMAAEEVLAGQIQRTRSLELVPADAADGCL